MCSSLTPLRDQRVIDVKHSSVVRETYVYHESTIATPSISIPSMPCFRRTMQPFHYVVISKRSRGSSTGPGGKASLGHPFAAGRLQDTIIVGDVRWEKEQQTFHLVHFSCCLSEGDNILRSATVIPVACDDTYPNSVPFHLMK